MDGRWQTATTDNGQRTTRKSETKQMEREQRQQNGRSGNGNNSGGYRYNRHRGGRQKGGNRATVVDNDQQSMDPNMATGTGVSANGTQGEGANITISEGPSPVMLTLAELESRNADDLLEMAKELDITG